LDLLDTNGQVVLHVVVAYAWILVGHELKISIGTRFISVMNMTLVFNLARVRLFVLSGAGREGIVFVEAGGVDTESVHLFLILDTRLEQICLTAHR